jgi:hypothetical protein
MAHDHHIRHSSDDKSRSHLHNAEKFLTTHQGNGCSNTERTIDPGPRASQSIRPHGEGGKAQTNSRALPEPHAKKIGGPHRSSKAGGYD